MRNPQTSITYERIARDLGASLLILHFNGCAPLIFFNKSPMEENHYRVKI